MRRMGRVILPGAQPPTGTRTLFVPRGMESKTIPGAKIGKCLVPGCGAIFFKGEEAAWQKHVGDCARANMDAIEEAAQEYRQAGTIFDENQWDPEAAAALQETGKRMLKEGRLTLKPNERIGT